MLPFVPFVMEITTYTLFTSLLGTLDHLISAEALTKQISLKDALSEHIVPPLLQELRAKGIGILSEIEFNALYESIESMELDDPVQSRVGTGRLDSFTEPRLVIVEQPFAVEEGRVPQDVREHSCCLLAGVEVELLPDHVGTLDGLPLMKKLSVEPRSGNVALFKVLHQSRVLSLIPADRPSPRPAFRAEGKRMLVPTLVSKALEDV